MTRDEMTAIALSFPGAEEGMSYGRPSFKVNGKFFTRLRAEDDSVVLLEVPFDERRSEEHTSQLQSRLHLVCRLLLEKKKNTTQSQTQNKKEKTHSKRHW